MIAGFTISVALGQSKINNVDDSSFVLFTDHEIIGFDISVKEAFSMHGFQSINYL